MFASYLSGKDASPEDVMTPASGKPKHMTRRVSWPHIGHKRKQGIFLAENSLQKQ